MVAMGILPQDFASHGYRDALLSFWLQSCAVLYERSCFLLYEQCSIMVWNQCGVACCRCTQERKKSTKNARENSQKWAKSGYKSSQNRPWGALGGHPGPKTASDTKKVVFGYPFWPPGSTLLGAFSAHVAIQGRPEAQKLGFWKDLVARSFFEQI